ncbi:hypothetical protein FRC04_009263 [Tulasnella sp. 424]|nr:hypothetical protein FRC04_009263 [Tulasnella sp. 424]KAG8973085.1 hypothetical protein FRC05_009093 [Tulasnella sp. 425]
MTSSVSTPVFSTVAATTRRPMRATSKTTRSGGGLATSQSVKGVTRRPLGVISTSNQVNNRLSSNAANVNYLPSIASSIEQIQQQDLDAWFADVKKRALISSSPSGSETDYKEEMKDSLKKAIKLVTQAQEVRPELFSECNALVRALRTVIRLLDANYTNEDWYERPPPSAINQTLRRLKNSLQNLVRSPSSAVVPASQVTEFVHKFQLISKSMVTPA